MKIVRHSRGPTRVVGWAMLLLALGATAWAEESALRKAPSQDCAVVTSMPGFPRIHTSSLVDQEVVMEGEGVVIRQSRIENGKIVIPPAGLYYTVRTDFPVGFWRWPLANFPVLLLGKTYYLADHSHNYGVKRDFDAKRRQPVPYGMEMSALELSGVETSWGYDSLNQTPTFQVLKPSGNYYGASFTATWGGPFARSPEDALAGKPLPGPAFYQTTRIASSGNSYLIVKDVTNTQAKVTEWVFSEVKTVDLAERAVTATLAVGGTLELGSYRARVLAIDAAQKTVQVAMIDAAGETVAQKTLGPLSGKVMALLPSIDSDLATLLLKHDKVEVGLAAYNQPFAEAGMVKLVGYINLMQTTMAGVWAPDPRFVVYHDT